MRHACSVATTVFTDGACTGNPGPGGWAWAVPDGPFASGAEAHTTNQRMEIQAALEAARALSGPVRIVSDSTYVVHCFRDKWWEGWLRKGWLNSQKKPVANRDLWEPLIELYRAEPGRLEFDWVKGHSNDVMNDLVDRLAVEAARSQEGQTGVGVPPVLGPPDDVAGAASTDLRAPEGRRVVVAGHKPPELGGYDDNPISEAARAQLVKVLSAKRQLHPDLVVLTGLGLGAEQLAAEAAIEAGVPFVAVLPYPDPQSVWPKPSQKRFEGLVDLAADRVVLQSTAPDTKQNAGAALARRDAWLARNAHEAIVVWDRGDAGVGRLVRSLTDHLGEDDVWVVEPPR